MMGAGILSLSIGGKHQNEMAKRAGDWVLAHPFSGYTERVGGRGNRFFCGAYYCSQGIAQLGGQNWKGFFPPLVMTLLQSQTSIGAWKSEVEEDELSSQTPPYQLLPVYPR